MAPPSQELEPPAIPGRFNQPHGHGHQGSQIVRIASTLSACKQPMCSRSSPRPRRLAFGPFGSLQTRSTLEALPRRAKAEATGNARDRILQNRGMVRKLPRSGSPAGTGSARHLTGGGGAWLTGLDWLIGYGYYPVRAIGWAIVTLTRLLSSCAESLAVAILHSWSNGPRREALSERSASARL